MTAAAADSGRANGPPASVSAIMAAIRAEIVDGPPSPGVAPVSPAPEDAVAGPVAEPVADAVAPVLPHGLDAEVRALLAPLLRDWLDAHLPELVEAAVTAEIRRLTGQASTPIDKRPPGA